MIMVMNQVLAVTGIVYVRECERCFHVLNCESAGGRDIFYEMIG